MIGQVVLERLVPDYMSAAMIGSTVPRNVVRMEAVVCGGERCVTTLTTAAQETKLCAALCDCAFVLSTIYFGAPTRLVLLAIWLSQTSHK